jgi:hypothetical protein
MKLAPVIAVVLISLLLSGCALELGQGVAAWQGEDVTAHQDRERGFYVVPPGAIWRVGQRRKLRTIGALSELAEWGGVRL